VTILATDVNPHALAVARRGRYREWSFRNTPGWIRDRWFHRRGTQSFQLDPRIRQMVTFAPLNLADDGYPSVMTNTTAMDVILCRNVLMYFAGEALRATVARLQHALAAGGWLAVSPVELSSDLFRGLASINFPGAILYRKDSVPVARQHWPAETTSWSPPEVLRALPALDDVAPQSSATSPQLEVTERLAAPTELQRARALADEGELDRARTLCETVPDRLDPEVQLLLAAICQEQGDIRPALDALRRAIYLAPDLAAPHFLLGTLQIRQGERKRGRRAMETVVNLLSDVRGDEPLRGGGGLTAGRVLESARMYLELLG
jgi:chemotaxis protein methyltransferase CheR